MVMLIQTFHGSPINVSEHVTAGTHHSYYVNIILILFLNEGKCRGVRLPHLAQSDVTWKGFNVWFTSIFSSQYQSVVKETGNENNEGDQSKVILLMFR